MKKSIVSIMVALSLVTAMAPQKSEAGIVGIFYLLKEDEFACNHNGVCQQIIGIGSLVAILGGLGMMFVVPLVGAGLLILDGDEVTNSATAQELANQFPFIENRDVLRSLAGEAQKNLADLQENGFSIKLKDGRVAKGIKATVAPSKVRELLAPMDLTQGQIESVVLALQ